MVKVTIDDVRKAGYCVAGARRWFEAHRLNFSTFLTEGISEDAFLATGDALAFEVVKRKRERLAGG